jgi:Uma2 family endonuclease
MPGILRAAHARMAPSVAMREAPATREGPYTWDDFLAIEEDDLRELIDGDLVEVEVPKRRHEKVVAELLGYLWTWCKQGHGGQVLPSNYKIRISAKRGVVPDVQVYRRDNPAAVGQDDGLVEGRPDLVVEVISPPSRRYDRVIKLRWYASIGVPEYGIVDPEDRTLDRLVLENGRYAIAEVAVDDDVFRPASCEGLEIPLKELWI